jgi:pyruvate dehydrogenase complex dehydrogenase (E1) component
MTLDNLKTFRDELKLPITDAQLEENPYQPPYFHPGQDAPEIQYMHERRRALGGYLPERRSRYVDFKLPTEDSYKVAKQGSGTQEVATTMAFVRRRSSVTASCRSFLTRREPLAWMPSSLPRRFTTRTVSTTFR